MEPLHADNHNLKDQFKRISEKSANHGPTQERFTDYNKEAFQKLDAQSPFPCCKNVEKAEFSVPRVSIRSVHPSGTAQSSREFTKLSEI